MQPLRDAAERYTRESSFIHEWAEARMMLEDEGLQIETGEAHKSFLAYAKERNDKSAQRMRMPEFKDTLKAAFKAIKFDHTTTRPNPGRSRIKGFGQRIDAFGESSNVVALDQHRPPPGKARHYPEREGKVMMATSYMEGEVLAKHVKRMLRDLDCIDRKADLNVDENEEVVSISVHCAD